MGMSWWTSFHWTALHPVSFSVQPCPRRYEETPSPNSQITCVLAKYLLAQIINTNCYGLNIYWVQGSLCACSHLILVTTLQGEYCGAHLTEKRVIWWTVYVTWILSNGSGIHIQASCSLLTLPTTVITVGLCWAPSLNHREEWCRAQTLKSAFLPGCKFCLLPFLSLCLHLQNRDNPSTLFTV